MTDSRNPDARGECLALIDGLRVPAFVIDSSGRLVAANRSWTSEYAAGDDDPWGWLAPVADESRPRVRRVLAGALAEKQPVEVEFVVHRRDGSMCTLVCAAGPSLSSGSEGEFLGLCWDASDRVRNEQRLAFMAGHDALTGLANRHTFEDALARAASRVQRGAEAVLLMLDLDHLKTYNDARGHLDGDQALVNLAMLLRTHVRAADLPARIGGDEFAILLEDADLDEAVEIAGRIRAAAGDEEFVIGAREHGLGVSIGIARVVDGLQPRVVMDRADSALYRAKETGRNQVVVWDTLDAGAMSGDRAEVDVQDAFARDALCVAFQPVVSIADGSVSYYESLVRCTMPDGTQLRPDEFLPAVERVGLMGRLTRWVVSQAIERVNEVPGIAISVNLSESDLVDPLLLDDVESLLEEASSSTDSVVFEIAEPTLLANLADGREWMDRLARHGARFVLDDFGSGAGVFVLLREPHIEQVKLSRTVMHALAQESATQGFVSAMRELIESQGRIAVASYVESESMLAHAEAAGFTWAQGFEFSEPTPNLVELVEHMRQLQVG